MSAPRTIRLVVEYDGTDLCGWQRQANGPTVQQHLEEALAEMVGGPVTVTGASRTDAGVHALGQVASFRTTTTIPARGFRLGLRAHLPPSIAVVAVDEAPGDFHPRFHASGKHYRYTVLTRSAPSPLRRRTSWHLPGELDLAAMRAAAAHLVGEHDFDAFRAAGCSARTTRRRIEGIEVSAAEPDTIVLDVRGNAFLRNMVRIVVGTLVQVGQGERPAAQLAEILAGLDRGQAGPTAPACGLCLVEVRYLATDPAGPG